MKPLPEKIKVGGRIYDVIVENNPDMIIDDKTAGFHNPRRLTITVMSPEFVHPLKQREILLHEIIHAVAHVGAIDISEDAVRGLANILFGVFQNNDISCLSEKYEREVIS